MSDSCRNRSWLQLVDWRVVIVAGVPLWGLIGGWAVWQKLTPRAGAAAPVAVSPTTPVSQPIELLPPPRTAPPPNPFTDPTVRAAKPEPAVTPVEIDPDLAEAFGDGVKKVFWAVLAGKPEAEADGAPARKPAPPGCQTFDTAVHFVKNYDTARQRAARDGKLVFVLHLSGNLDDAGFT